MPLPIIKLSICIATRNRAEYLFETVKCFLKQITDDVEIVIVDGASSDNTKELIEKLILTTTKIKYFYESKNSGVDGDFDKSIQYANGKFCWLFSDDDLIETGAVEKIIQSLRWNPEVLVLNSSVHTKKYKNVLVDRVLKQNKNHFYIDDGKTAFKDLGNYLSFIGAIVVRRYFWLSRQRQAYQGSAFAHLAVIFQLPLPKKIILLVEPLVKIRYGNSEWAPRGFDIWFQNWPNLIYKLGHLPSGHLKFVAGQSYYQLIKFCVFYRAIALYDKKKYDDIVKGKYKSFSGLIFLVIALVPAKIVNIVAITLSLFTKNSLSNVYMLSNSPESPSFSKRIARFYRVLD
jgi:glycosyltransferase involved in cell wall biosynthesis